MNKPRNLRGLGSSPRVRSRPNHVGRARWRHGIISACAEQTSVLAALMVAFWDHLRVCGADELAAMAFSALRGSSPRVRSRLDELIQQVGCGGIISACAEQTILRCRVRRRYWDHLRVCGADHDMPCRARFAVGSSPRVRSRPVGNSNKRRTGGIISACAEQTSPDPPAAVAAWDHLRVCGADRTTSMSTLMMAGSSPRVRSRQVPPIFNMIPVRIISACAEQTRTPVTPTTRPKDHLRVCGADFLRFCIVRRVVGSSPRVRSRRSGLVRGHVSPGIISACAEQTAKAQASAYTDRDHLRVCGADRDDLTRNRANVGSSPRVRSRPAAMPDYWLTRGIISACAEQTPLWYTRLSPCKDHLRVCGADYMLRYGYFVQRGSSPRVRSRPW